MIYKNHNRKILRLRLKLRYIAPSQNCTIKIN